MRQKYQYIGEPPKATHTTIWVHALWICLFVGALIAAVNCAGGTVGG